MNLVIPFTKDIKFNSNIGEILSVSLEHEFTAGSSEILGNFIVSGDYKTHEVSINKEHFEYTLPFSVELTERIDSDSVDFAVRDFTYEVVDNNTLRVNIEYSVNALEEKKEEEVTLEEMLDEIDREEPVEEKLEEAPVEREEEIMVKEEEKETVTEEVKSTVIDNISNTEEQYVTYHVYMYHENDTIESICTKYNTSKNILEEYNDLSNLNIGDKIIIPEINE